MTRHQLSRERVEKAFRKALAADAANKAAFTEERAVLEMEPRTAEQRAEMDRALARVNATRAALQDAALDLYYAALDLYYTLRAEMEEDG